MGFASYFLIVWDFVRFARENGIPARPAGPACGAVVSYVLYLSHVDPLEYDLLFERFLDPNRSEAPDIDIDFCQDRREQVIDYVKQKYGEASVAQIGTFGTLAAKAAIKDVGRVLDVPLERVNQHVQAGADQGAATSRLDEALEQSPDFRREYDSDPQVARAGRHRPQAGGDEPQRRHARGRRGHRQRPAHRLRAGAARRAQGRRRRRRSGEAVVTTQWVMGDLEKVGLLKMDFLGLRTLTLLDNARQADREDARRSKIDPI